MAMGVMVDEPRTDPVDFETWVSARVPAFLRYAYLVTDNGHDAQDAVQEALAAACAKWPRVSASHDIDAYVRRMIANAHISRWRRTRRRDRLVGDDALNALGAGAPADDRPDITDTDEMWRACLALPRQQRVALVLRFYEDLSFAQIAAILDCAEPTARSHVRRGLVSLRRAMRRLPTDERRPDDPAR